MSDSDDLDLMCEKAARALEMVDKNMFESNLIPTDFEASHVDAPMRMESFMQPEDGFYGR